MGLPSIITHHARNEIEDVAIVVGRRVRNVDDIQIRQLFAGCGLRGIDAGRRFHHIHDLMNFLDVKQFYIQGRHLAYFNTLSGHGIKTLLLHAQLVAARSKPAEETAACEISHAPDPRGHRRRLHRNPRGGNRDAVLISNRDSQGLRRVRS